MTLINTAITGIRASQLALSTTGHNIVNANTEGYSRQSVSTETAIPQKQGPGFVGNGVLATEIFRNTDKNLVDQVANDISVLSELDSYLGNITKLDNLFAGESSNLAAAMNRFFDAVNEAANDPASMMTRQLLITEANVLMDNFRQMESRLQSQNRDVNSRIDTVATDISNIGQQLADLNRSIGALGASTQQQPNDLLDKRDQLIRELSAYVDVETVLRDDLTMDVSIGQGQPLVVGLEARRLVTESGQADASQRELLMVAGNRRETVTNRMVGGELGGLLRVRDDALTPAMNSVGRLIMGLVDGVNAQHQLGMDLEGNAGKPVFTDINSPALATGRVKENSGNSPRGDRVVSANITDVSALTTSDYQLSFSGPGGRYAVTRLSDGQVVSQGQLGSAQLPHTIELEGFELTLESGTFSSGDRFLVQPTRNAATGMQALISRPEELALAAPVRTEAAAGNQGGAFLQLTEVLSEQGTAFTQSGQLDPPVMIRFTSPTTYDVLDASDPANPVPLQPPLMDQPFTPGGEANIFPDQPGGTTVSTLDPALNIQAQQVQIGLDNGYGPENLTIETLDPATDAIRQQFLTIDPNESADSIAARLSLLDGVTAQARSELTLGDFQSGGGDPLQLSLNGVDLTDPTYVPPGSSDPQPVPEPPTADFLRDRINANETLAAQGIYAISDGQTLIVRASTGVDLTVRAEGSGGGFQLNDDPPEVLGATAQDFTIGGRVDVQLAPNTTLMSNEPLGIFGTAPEAVDNFMGYQLRLGSGTGEGAPAAGDRFMVGWNSEGRSDNRNAAAMLALSSDNLLSDGNLSLQGAYGQIVEEIGIMTNQTRRSQEAAESMLRQSMDAWQSLSGVNIEEEAARLIELEQHYNASARLIALARELFDTLLSL